MAKKMTTLQRINALKRNDLEGALNIAEDLLKSSGYTPGIAQTLLMLQDDYEGWIEKLNELEKSLKL